MIPENTIIKTVQARHARIGDMLYNPWAKCWRPIESCYMSREGRHMTLRAKDFTTLDCYAGDRIIVRRPLKAPVVTFRVLGGTLRKVSHPTASFIEGIKLRGCYDITIQ